ncbi:bacteriorhodopsin-like [Zwartia sp.]|uniref:bacteriorhodopsin-like n=1 Tax=Zwartia sp. TaxID=2978004 RepID=UPI0027193D34|nr:bacteriorhodopsin-like [Zwartia sp.]MDO9023650.1 bacteriorhodopsin-like [Zwartia sp.]
MQLTFGQYELIYNAFSFGTAAFLAATIFFWLGLSQVSQKYKTAVIITGLVTFIAGYHYLRIFASWGDAYTAIDGVVKATGVPFNVAYRYVDWLLTVPLLLVELILVMGLSRAETVSKSVKLGTAAALMIILGYPGEVSGGIDSTRMLWGALSMIPFLYIVINLFSGLSESIAKQPQDVRGLVSAARWVVVLSWSFYPIVYFAPFVMSVSGGTAVAIIEVGYTIADVVAKAVFGVMIFMIAVRKSQGTTA